MDPSNLVRMANRIGEFFDAMPDQAQAVDGVATHLRKFWEPRMRRALLSHVDDHGMADLHVLVAEALSTRRDQIS